MKLRFAFALPLVLLLAPLGQADETPTIRLRFSKTPTRYHCAQSRVQTRGAEVKNSIIDQWISVRAIGKTAAGHQRIEITIERMRRVTVTGEAREVEDTKDGTLSQPSLLKPWRVVLSERAKIVSVETFGGRKLADYEPSERAQIERVARMTAGITILGGIGEVPEAAGKTWKHSIPFLGSAMKFALEIGRVDKGVVYLDQVAAMDTEVIKLRGKGVLRVDLAKGLFLGYDMKNRVAGNGVEIVSTAKAVIVANKTAAPAKPVSPTSKPVH